MPWDISPCEIVMGSLFFQCVHNVYNNLAHRLFSIQRKCSRFEGQIRRNISHVNQRHQPRNIPVLLIVGFFQLQQCLMQRFRPLYVNPNHAVAYGRYGIQLRRQYRKDYSPLKQMPSHEAVCCLRQIIQRTNQASV